jgi:hypothetical protein
MPGASVKHVGSVRHCARQVFISGFNPNYLYLDANEASVEVLTGTCPAIHIRRDAPRGTWRCNRKNKCDRVGQEASLTSAQNEHLVSFVFGPAVDERLTRKLRDQRKGKRCKAKTA